jgi:hypothetical protein
MGLPAPKRILVVIAVLLLLAEATRPAKALCIYPDSHAKSVWWCDVKV